MLEARSLILRSDTRRWKYLGLGRQPELRQNFLTVREGEALHRDAGWENFYGSDGNRDGCRDFHRQEQEVSIAGHTKPADLPSEESLIVGTPKGRKEAKG